MKFFYWGLLLIWLAAAAVAIYHKDFTCAVVWFGGFLIFLKKI